VITSSVLRCEKGFNSRLKGAPLGRLARSR